MSPHTPKFLLKPPRNRSILGSPGEPIHVEHQGPVLHDGKERHTFLIIHQREVQQGIEAGQTKTTQSRFHLFPERDAEGNLSVTLEPEARDIHNGNPTLPALQAVSTFMKDSGYESVHSLEAERRGNHKLVYHYRPKA